MVSAGSVTHAAERVGDGHRLHWSVNRGVPSAARAACSLGEEGSGQGAILGIRRASVTGRSLMAGSCNHSTAGWGPGEGGKRPSPGVRSAG
ncbi:hypothetical protein SSAG_01045 [Streptomyces sp. Mg1]|nr:hypothetical protein SSAG_01045 [Streptomyces sp. Mg1]